MMRALDSAAGFPSRPTSASSMLGLLMPEEVRRNFMRPPGVVLGCAGRLVKARAFVEGREPRDVLGVDVDRGVSQRGHTLSGVLARSALVKARSTASAAAGRSRAVRI